MQKSTTTLVILDGWGHTSATKYNAIANANTPNFDRIYQNYPHRLIECSGVAAGLPKGQMGNSEVGHITIGSGRIVMQSLERINEAVANGAFQSNVAYNNAIDFANRNQGTVHIIGLLSDGGVHSHQKHMFAAIQLAVSKGAKVALHIIADGRDTPPQSFDRYLDDLLQVIAPYSQVQIATIAGRFYAMDRDQRWDRIQLAYQAIVNATSEQQFNQVKQAVAYFYNNQITDEFIKPTVITPCPLTANDSIVFMNFRADRARQLTKALVSEDFSAFERQTKTTSIPFVATTDYDESLQLTCAFNTQSLANNLGDYLAKQGKSQLRIAETEKYSHVTYFFSGGCEQPYSGEQRILIPSPKVETYDLQPEMSAPAVVAKVVDAIQNNHYDFIVVNLANGDMVGHSGNYEAALQAVALIDDCVGQIEQATIESNNQCLITADHGNIEQMFDQQSNQPHTSHTTNPVPLIYVGKNSYQFKPNIDGGLADIAPTILHLMALAQPKEMQGQSLLK